MNYKKPAGYLELQKKKKKVTGGLCKFGKKNRVIKMVHLLVFCVCIRKAVSILDSKLPISRKKFFITVIRFLFNPSNVMFILGARIMK